MSDLLSIGASGVRAYQTALSTVGENIANAGVAGYSRRSASMNEITAGRGTAALATAAGNGVTVAGIARAADSYATSSVRSATSDLSRTTTASSWLSRIESAMTGDQVTERMTAFYASAGSLAAEPQSTALRANMIGAATSAAIAFTATGEAFDQAEADLDATANQAAMDMTSLARSLASINDGLSRTQPNSAASAQLADQRDQILASMSSLTDISTTSDSLGRTTVRLGGPSGPEFVTLRSTGAVSYARDAQGNAQFTVSMDGNQSPLISQGGSMAGMVEGAQAIAVARKGFEDIASNFTSAVNTIQTKGDDLDGNPGTALFSVGARPTDISVALTSGAEIAAAGRGKGVRDASNLATLQSDRMSKKYEASTTQLITDNATVIKQKDTIASAQTSIRDGAVTVLSSATGVSLDSEAVDLMRFQQAYSASSRVIQVARETFQSILQIG